ncbi:MAG: DUF3137 domain-containing protein [Bacteroidales bacterium]|nr:DUF3137 domain-containing protein [Bacteroidales bacterium]
MENTKSFREFYDNQLLPDLKILDQQRKKVSRTALLIALLVLLVVVAETKLIPSDGNDWKGFVQIITVVIGFIFISVASQGYRKNFKKQIISKITKFVNNDLVYNPDGSISKPDFVNSNIFKNSCDRFKGEDHICGTIDKTKIEFSEVVAQYKTTSGTGSNRKTTYHTFFKGIFFIADFNKNFSTRTFVLPDFAEKTFGKLGQKMQSMNLGRGELIKLENPEFEKEFVVYGDDQVEARYILSTALMQRILDFKNKWKTKVYLSFVDSKVNIAIEIKKNLFETRLFKSIVDYDLMEENMNYLVLLVEIVNDLNLNTRIWNKD